MSDDRFELFVSCVEGKPVARFGSDDLIGAVRISDEKGRRIEYDTERVVALTKREVAAARKAYRKVLERGGLVVRTREEWDAWRAAQKARSVAAGDP